MVHLSNVHEDHHNQHENIHNMCNGKEHPRFKFEKKQWKMEQKHDKNFQIDENPL